MKKDENSVVVFDKLLELQSLMKKESSLKELCKKKNLN